MIGGAAFCVALATAALQAEPAAGGGDVDVAPAVVLLLAGRDTEPLAGRLAAELGAVGLDVQREEPPADGAPDPVASALRVRARAAVWVPAGVSAAEVWILDRETGRTKIRQSITAEGDEMTPLVALRTVEFLRASLLGLRPRAPAAPAQAAAQPPAPADVTRTLPPPEAAPAPTAPRVSVALGGGVTTSAGGVGPIPSIAAVVRAPLHGVLGVEALGLLSVSPARVGSVSVTASLAGAGLTLRLLAGRRGSLDLGGGVMAAFVHAEGDTGGGFGGLSWGATLAALYGRVGAGLAFTPWLGLRAEALIGGVFQRPELRVVQTEAMVASWGRPFGTAIVDLEARWR